VATSCRENPVQGVLAVPQVTSRTSWNYWHQRDLHCALQHMATLLCCAHVNELVTELSQCCIVSTEPAANRAEAAAVDWFSTANWKHSCFSLQLHVNTREQTEWFCNAPLIFSSSLCGWSESEFHWWKWWCHLLLWKSTVYMMCWVICHFVLLSKLPYSLSFRCGCSWSKRIKRSDFYSIKLL